MSEPRTKAGRHWLDHSTPSFKKRLAAILAIEAEATDLDVERLWSVLSGIGVIEIGTWVHFEREDAELIAAEYSRLGTEGPA